MKRIHVRAFWGAAALLVVAASLAFGSVAASAAPNFHLGFVTQPTDALPNTLITSSPFDPGGNPVQVELLNAANKRVTTQDVIVTLSLATGSGLASDTLGPIVPQTTVNGVATFGPGSGLTLQSANSEQLTDFKLVPATTDGTITGAASNGFDIWSQACSTSGCTLTLNHTNNANSGSDLYTNPGGGNLSGTVLSSSQVNLFCAGQTVIVADSAYTTAFSTTSPVKVLSHITVDEMKAAANNGQAHVSWCIGLDSNAQWTSIGVSNAVREDTNLDGTPDLWVALAPSCPKKSPSSGAPCITRQYGDGSGGNFTEGWLPGGDPTRRT